MNPITQFEDCLRQVSVSKLPPHDKSRKLEEVSRTIEGYLKRVEAQQKASDLSDGANAAMEIAKEQLRDLATQASTLANVYHRESSRVSLH